MFQHFVLIESIGICYDEQSLLPAICNIRLIANAAVREKDRTLGPFTNITFAYGPEPQTVVLRGPFSGRAVGAGRIGCGINSKTTWAVDRGTAANAPAAA